MLLILTPPKKKIVKFMIDTFLGMKNSHAHVCYHYSVSTEEGSLERGYLFREKTKNSKSALKKVWPFAKFLRRKTIFGNIFRLPKM